MGILKSIGRAMAAMVMALMAASCIWVNMEASPEKGMKSDGLAIDAMCRHGGEKDGQGYKVFMTYDYIPCECKNARTYYDSAQELVHEYFHEGACNCPDLASEYRLAESEIRRMFLMKEPAVRNVTVKIERTI